MVALIILILLVILIYFTEDSYGTDIIEWWEVPKESSEEKITQESNEEKATNPTYEELLKDER